MPEYEPHTKTYMVIVGSPQKEQKSQDSRQIRGSHVMLLPISRDEGESRKREKNEREGRRRKRRK